MSDTTRRTSNTFTGHSDEQIVSALNGWARDQREREAWRDGDEATYRHNASLLEQAAARLMTAEPEGDPS